MISAPLHPDEGRRVQALHRLQILDTAAEARFDRLVELAALVVGAPIALISLIDRDRQWFKARVGLDDQETSRDVSFCAHAIVDDTAGLFVVEDAFVDARFADNPNVTGDPHVRFYAGRVVHDQAGLPLGTLCVLDREPRVLDDAQVQMLEHIATMVEHELERSDEVQLLEGLDASERNKALILDTLTEGVVLQDRTRKVVDWNSAAQVVLGLSADQMEALTTDGASWSTMHADGTEWPSEEHPATRVLETGQSISGEIMGVRRANGDVMWLRVNCEPVLDSSGTVTHALTVFADVTVEIVAAEARLEAERALRTSERTSRISLDALDEGVMLIGRGGHVHRVNPAAQRILGFDAAELTELWLSGNWKTFDEHGRVLDLADRPTVRALASGKPVVGDIVSWRRKDGELRTIRISCVPHADEDGAFVVAFTDITEDHMARRLLDATLDTAPVGLAILDTDRTILRCNTTFAEQAGRPMTELIGEDVVSLLHPDSRPDATDVGRQIRFGERSDGTIEQRVLRPDGSSIWVNTHLAVIPNPERPLAIAATFDVTEQRQLLLEVSRFEHLIQHSNDIIVVVDEHGNIKYLSPSSERILGYSPDGLLQQGGVFGLVHPDDLQDAVMALQELVSGARAGTPFTVRILAADGSWKFIECVGADLLDQPEVAGIVLTARDTTERVLLAQRLEHQALHDTLTDLPNRQLFDQRLSRAIARGFRNDTRLAVCFIDLDGFKQINDVHGHAMGDETLCRVADALRSTIREGDTAARVGGDEFVLILDSIKSESQAIDVATRVRDAIVSLSSPDVMFGASVGIAMSEPFDSTSSLVKRADEALYEAKSARDSSIRINSLG